MIELPPGEEPAERLLEAGPEALTEAELLGLLLGGRRGPRGRHAQAQALDLITAFGGVRELALASAYELARIKSIDATSAAAVVAAFELGRRLAGSRVENGSPFRTSAEIFSHFRGRLAPLLKEVFIVVLLDTRHRKLREVQVSEGSLNASIVHPREVFRPAIRDSAAAVILVHNHPSGHPEPSPEDVTLTRRLREAGELIGIRVLDHVIIGADRHFSFVETGWW